MSVYVFYYNESGARVFTKSSVNDEAKELLKRKGYKKHFFEVEAESAKEAIAKMKSNNDEYLNELKHYSDSLLFVGLVGGCHFFKK
ncbi:MULTISPECIES: hypothetical protein [Enterobacteriaceae]|uniref:hypothetical protein n=1 Tax=Enterobacteriaceae TaxID=543 RepID=UPI0010CC0852|nr:MULTISPECIES: hypothetical protein [Enterobacteriaceae]MCK7228989.1 hypothetical protein [Enterobacter asburiae]UAN42039.1 hypothetical protein KGP24_06115 [Enterobacter sp. JBIWA008]UXP22923.1 hypothetical protein N8O08_16840 [Enterobacter sp. 155105]GCU71214.1 hypothetical protein HmCmsJML053_00308 [Escherichia coli]